MSAAKPNFDGDWSVLIVTEKGTCDRAYRYPVKIENGSVGYAGSASFTVSGKVGDKGAVTVTVARGSQSATGTGPHVAAPTARAPGPRLRASAPAPGPPSAAPKFRFCCTYCHSTTSLQPPNSKPGLAPGFFLCAAESAGVPAVETVPTFVAFARETESPAPETHETSATFAGNRRRLDMRQRNSNHRGLT